VSSSPGRTSSETPSTAVSGPKSFFTADSDNTGSGEGSAGDPLDSPLDRLVPTDFV